MKEPKRCVGGSLTVWFLALRCSLPSEAAPKIYEATGTREQIQPVIDQFKRDVVDAPGTVGQPSTGTGWLKVASFDDLTAGKTTTVETKSGAFVSDGVVLIGAPGTPIILSAGTVVPGEANGMLFGDRDSRYPERLEAYSGPSVLALGDTWLPFGQMSASVREREGSGFRIVPFDAFGAVFINVDGSSGVSVAAGALSMPVRANTGDGNFSFFGMILDEVTAQPVAITMPNLNPDSDSWTVAVDDIMIGQTAIPEPSVLSCLSTGGFVIGFVLVYRRRGRWTSDATAGLCHR